MKSSQKGFTLIELLAVIVILAIIALIATPIVLNIITKAKKSAAADSVYGTMEAIKLVYTESMLDETSLDLPIEVTFTKNANSIKAGDPLAASTKTLKLSGTAPEEGTITLDKEGNFSASGLKVNGLTCTIASEKVTCGA